VGIRQAHLQIRDWLRQLPGVLRAEVARVGGRDALVVSYDPALLSAQARREIRDRLAGFPVHFRPTAPP
jgi:hypothetical protein